MADILMDSQAVPVTPAAGKAVIWLDATTKKLVVTDDAGIHNGLLSKKSSVGTVTPNAADTYITDSDLLIPSFGMKAGQLYRWTMTVTKTAAGTAAAIFQVRIGAARTTGDTSRASATQTTAQTGAVSSGIIHVTCQVRSVSATGQLVVGVGVQSNNVGLGSGITNLPATFDNTALAGQYVGLSINPGASGVWTIDSVIAELVG
jgi:hypothetical protein